MTYTCHKDYYPTKLEQDQAAASTCPDYFKWIHEDIKPWKRTGITREMVETGKNVSFFRVVIKQGKVYAERCANSYQTRDVFTVWGILQLLRLYPGKIPDLELLFETGDRTVVHEQHFQGPPPPIFHYCGEKNAYDIVFPVWSFWGWVELAIKPWEALLQDIDEGNKKMKYGRIGYPMHFGKATHGCPTKDQCVHRYKIYVEGITWSVSEKYILACDSMTLFIEPIYYDFFRRSLKPRQKYWPISRNNQTMCNDIKSAVEWGNANPDKISAGSYVLAMNNLKLGVEVVNAHDLVPKDGKGSSSTFVELHFDGQRFRTTTKDKDLSPVWNESFYFTVTDPSKLPSLTLDACIFHYNKSNGSKILLGKVRLTGTSFVYHSDAVLLHYPLEKKNIFSRSKGEIGLKVFVTDDPSIRASNPLPAVESFVDIVQDLTQDLTHDQIPPPVSFTDSISNTVSRKKTESRHTFHNIAKSNHEQKQQSKPAADAKPSVTFGIQEMKSSQPLPKVVQAFAGAQDYVVKETSPTLGGGKVVGGRVIRGSKPATSSSYDLVESMSYLFVRVVKARDLPSMDITGSLDPYVEVKIGNFKGTTNHFEKNQNPEWNKVFAFAEENRQSFLLEVTVKDRDHISDDVVGTVFFDLHEVPKRTPPDSPLAPQWYRIEKTNGEKKGELMLAVWRGTQADEAFQDAWHSDAVVNPDGSTISNYSQIRSKVYMSPRLWYVRVKVVEAQDLVSSDKSKLPDASVKVQIGNQTSKTKPMRGVNPQWNHDALFVAAEPFEEPLVFTVEDRVGANKDETIGNVVLPISKIEKRFDDKLVRGGWFLLEKSMSSAMEEQGKMKEKEKDKDKFFSRIHVIAFLDGGYHVLNESTYYSSDLRPSTRQLWKKPIGVLELGILNVDVLLPPKSRDGRGTSDTYCVAKYGHKWVRTRTIVNNLNPKFHEQYTWEVYDTATVLTLGVFDNAQIHNSSNGKKDSEIGKIRIRISTLETGRVYTHSYPLLSIHSSGLKKNGDVHLAIRFSCNSMLNMMGLYFKPHLPKMHYTKPLSIIDQERLRLQAMLIVAARLGRAEPPLRKEVVEYMSDTDSHLWSMRRSKANFNRLRNVFYFLVRIGGWFGEIAKWKNPFVTVLVHILYLMFVCFPDLILPTIFLYMFVIGMWQWRFRPRYPPHMDARLSCAGIATPEELDEEMDTFPTTKSSDIVRWRYDRLRSLAGRVQSVVGQIATQGERVHALLSWRDPRATSIFMVFCLVTAIMLYVTPPQMLFILSGFYLIRHPKLRDKTPGAPINFFRRLPALTDTMM
ncbi:unnamed protein product [Sphenostylis stenocarpa]|uniref:C2 domain-containing protein n=1 Tax=Sphenostylis stenocarpa TaxID=92480 RepID=A0AA86RMN1_9FABA|nr:unnamed protein product [Sphenostylis stenocarpa]